MNAPDALRGLLGVLSQEPLIGRLFFASVEMAILAGLLWIAIRVGRIRSPRLISVLWLVVLAKPLVALGVGTLLPVFEVEAPPVNTVVAQGQRAPSPIPSHRTNGTHMSYESPPALPPGSAPPVHATAPLPAIETPPAPPAPWRPDIGRGLTIAWAAGVALIALYTIIERIWLHRLITRSAPAPETVRAVHRLSAAQLGIRRPPRILVTDALESPALTGAVAPAILVPSWLVEEAEGPALDWALRHELMHWKLRDPIANAVRQLAQILFFFHPVTWWAGFKWEEAAELACDRALVQSESEAEDYAGQLYAMLARIHGRRQRTVMGGLFATRTQIGRRVAALLGNPFKSPARLGVFTLLCVLAVAIASLCLGGAFAANEPGDADEIVSTPNRYEGPVELEVAWNPFKKTIPLALEGYAPNGQRLLSIREVIFLKSGDEVLVRMKGSEVSWPKAFWLLHIALLDDDGQTVAETEEEVENSGFIISKPWGMTRTIEMPLGPWDRAQMATRFTMTLERVDDEPAGDDARPVAEGTVRNAAGQPVAGAQVLLIPAGGTVHRESVGQPLSEKEREWSRGIGTPSLRTTQTDGAGHFSLDAPSPDYLLVVDCPEGYCRVTGHELAASSDLTLQPWARVEGTVLGPDGPVPDAAVSFSHPATGRELVGRGAASMETTVLYATELGARTDAAGRFVFERVPPGPAELGRFAGPSDRGGGFTMPGTSVEIGTKIGQTTGVLLGAIAAHVEGRLVLPESADLAIDWTKVHAELAVPWPGDEGPLLPGEDDFFTDGMDTFLANDANRQYRRRIVPVNADGTFRIEGLPGGRFIFKASVYSDATDEPWRWRLLATARHEIQIPLAQGEVAALNLGDIPLELAEKDYRSNQGMGEFRVEPVENDSGKEEAKAPGKVSVHVKVVGSGGEPAGIVQVNPWKLSDEAPKPTTPGEWPDPSFWQETGTGRVWVNQRNVQSRDETTLELDPGTYRITAYAVNDGHRGNPTPFGVSDTITIDNAEGKCNTEIRLQQGVPLTIRFVDSETGAPVPHVGLLLLRDDGLPIGYGSSSFALHASEEGTALFSDLAPGTYWLRARKAAQRPNDPNYTLPDDPLRVDVAADDERKMLDVALQPAPLTDEGIAERWPFVVFGSVTDKAGVPVPDVEIWAMCGMGTLRGTGSTRTGQDGAYTLRFRAAMGTRDEATGKYYVGLQAATITARKGGWYETNLSRQGGLTMADTKPDKDNAWGADPDSVILPNKPARLDFVMAPAARVKGRIIGGNGKPLAKQRFTVCGKELPPSSSALLNGETDESGAFALEVPRRVFWFEVDKRKSPPINFAVPGEYELELGLGPKDKQMALEVVSFPPETTLETVVTPPETKPDLREALLEQLERLSYVDETAEGKKSLAASGHAVRFERGKDARYVEAVQIYASRYGNPEPPDEDFHLYLLNEQYQILADVRYPYATIERGDMRWYTLRTPSIEVPEVFYAALAFNPHRTKGVYLGYDERVEESHSFRGLPDSGYEPFGEDCDWMVRVWLAKEPTGEKGVQHLADWKPPVHTDPFEDCVEVKYDDGNSGGVQSYGGAGPAIRFDLSEKGQSRLASLAGDSPLSLVGLRVYASRYGSGYDPETATVKVTVLDPEGNVLFEQAFPYALFSYKEEWVDLVFEKPVPCGEAAQPTILLDPEAHQTKGVYFHYNKDPETSHSAVAKKGVVVQELPEREWMFRAYFSSGE